MADPNEVWEQENFYRAAARQDAREGCLVPNLVCWLAGGYMGWQLGFGDYRPCLFALPILAAKAVYDSVTEPPRKQRMLRIRQWELADAIRTIDDRLSPPRHQIREYGRSAPPLSATDVASFQRHREELVTELEEEERYASLSPLQQRIASAENGIKKAAILGGLVGGVAFAMTGSVNALAKGLEYIFK